MHHGLNNSDDLYDDDDDNDDYDLEDEEWTIEDKQEARTV